MIKFSIKLLIARLKWFLVMTIALGITLAFITSLITSSEAIKTSLKNKAYKNYGEHSGLLIGIKESKSLLNNNNFDAGEYQLIDTLKISEDLSATIGWMNIDAFKIGHINLIKGKFPTNENEVAIESFYLEKLDPTWKLGDTKKLLINNNVTQVKLVGIIENYSAKWSVPYNIEKGVNDFPNILVANKDNSLTSNFLIKFNKDPKENEEEMLKLLEIYNDQGIINEKLFYKGLNQYDNITNLTFFFQIITLIVASFCFWSLFYYFNFFQLQKDALFKAAGSNNLNLYKLHFFQCLIIFLSSILFSIPLNIALHKLIIKKTFFEGELNPSQLSTIINTVSIWIIILFTIVVIISTKSINKFNKKSINNILHNNSHSKNKGDYLIYKFSSFIKKQLVIQMVQYPKHSLLIIFNLSICTMIILFSFFLQKESEGIWDAKQDYYIDSQEIYSYENIQNLNVLAHKGLTFPIHEVKQLEQTRGIKYIDKNPFMIDVHPLIKPNLLTSSIENWIKQNGSLNNLYEQDIIIPNVSYRIVNEVEFGEIYKSKDFESFKGKILLILPKTEINNNSKLIGEKLSFIKMYRESDQLKTKKWEFEVFDVIGSANSNENNMSINYNEITILLDEKTAVDSKIFTGYKDLTIYLEDNISSIEEKIIDSLVYEMVASIPGSLYQKISTTQIEEMKISSYIGFLGKLSFLISLFLSMTSIISILLSKYYIKKRTWGIYLSLGMRKRFVMKLLSFEIFIYFFISIVISTILFFLSMKVLNHVYPTSFYTIYYIFAVLFILIIATLGVFVLSKIIKNQSILDLLRLKE